MASEIIRGAGLERYYAERETWAPRPEPASGSWDRVPVSLDGKGRAVARVAVDGLRCASCVWVTERVLENSPGVSAATVSYATGRATLQWDPTVTDLPTLAGRIAALGYRPRPLTEAEKPDRDLAARLGVAAFAAMNIMLLAASVYAGWWGEMEPRYSALFHWTQLVLATPVALWCAEPFFRGAWVGLRNRRLHMDLPIALGISILYLHGAIATLLGRDAYLDSLAMLVALLLAGRLLEARGRRRSAEAALALATSVPRTARRETASGLETVPVEALQPGDRIDLGPGDEIGADGEVCEGSGQVRMALVTGEAAPVMVGPGDRVVAGAVLLDGALSVRVEAAGRNTLVSRMATELEAATDRPVEPSAADRIAPWFTAATLIIAAATFTGWWLLRGPPPALTATVAVLVVACPCALALAQPLAAAAGLGASARRGLLLRSTEALLRLERVTLVVFDKTGTLTGGALRVAAAESETLRVAAGLERYSNHPIARAIVDEAIRRGIPLPRASRVQEIPGNGLSGELDGEQWRLSGGGPGEVRLIDERGESRTIRLADQVRPDAARTVAALKNEGLRVALLTGDHPDIATRIGEAAGVDEIVARQDPLAKAAWIAARQAEGNRVAFAGDGVNDGPALAAADVGIAMGQGASSSVLVADGVIATESLGPLLAGRRAARAARRAITINLRRSLVYNILAVTAAVAGLVNPLVAAVLMPLSSGLVIWGASRVEARVRREEK